MTTTLRRLYLDKRLAARERGDLAIAALWQAKQEAEPGTPLPEDFPLRGRLAEHGYTTREDLDGADEEELRCLGFQVREAQRILAAFAAL